MQLIHDLLKLAHAEAGHVALACRPTDAGEIVREVAGDFRQQAIAAHLQLRVCAGDGIHALAGPHGCARSSATCISSAASTRRNGRLALEVGHRVSGGPHPGKWVAVSVIDNGPGIPQDKQESNFHEYVRLDPESAQGAGIGLAISRHFARLMGGT